jgi:hypothetical protein
MKISPRVASDSDLREQDADRPINDDLGSIGSRFSRELEQKLRSCHKPLLTHTRYAFAFVTELQQISMKFLLRGSGLRKNQVNFT